MKMKIVLLLVMSFSSCIVFSQSISPIESTEFCPLTDVTFTVTLPRIADNSTPHIGSWTNNPLVVSGVTNLTHTQTQTTFTFIGRFRDENIKQVFKLDFTPNGGSGTVHYF